MTLRQVLLAEMDDIVHFDKKFECCQEGQEGKITAFFADGTSATGDMLVAADGGNSRVRQQFLPHAKRIDTGILIIAGKLLLTQETRRLLPANLFEGPASVVAPKGLGMFVAVQEFVHDPKDVIYSIGGNSCEKHSSLLFENTKDHILWRLIARRDGMRSFFAKMSFLRIAARSRFCRRFATTKTRWSNMDLMLFEVR